jgi:acetyl-CoA carboxylase alpha subunit
MAEALRAVLLRQLGELTALTREELLERRRIRLRSFGVLGA